MTVDDILAADDDTDVVEPGQAAEFDTMTPHWIAGYGGPVEILMIFDRHGEQAHVGRAPQGSIAKTG